MCVHVFFISVAAPTKTPAASLAPKRALRKDRAEVERAQMEKGLAEALMADSQREREADAKGGLLYGSVRSAMEADGIQDIVSGCIVHVPVPVSTPRLFQVRSCFGFFACTHLVFIKHHHAVSLDIMYQDDFRRNYFASPDIPPGDVPSPLDMPGSTALG